MSFLEMFIYSYDGVSPPILSMPSLSMILVQGSDLIKSMKWRLVFLVLSYFLFVSFIYCLLLRVKVWVHGHGLKAQGDLSGISIRHIRRIDSIDPGTISFIEIREKILSTCMTFMTHKQTAQLSSDSFYT